MGSALKSKPLFGRAFHPGETKKSENLSSFVYRKAEKFIATAVLSSSLIILLVIPYNMFGYCDVISCLKYNVKREYLMICFYFASKPYVVTPHLNHSHLNQLIETVQMWGHNIMFLCIINKNYP